MPSQETIPALYPQVYSFRPDFESSGRLKRAIALLEERLFYRLLHKGETDRVKRVTGMRSGSVLDVGCGTGERLCRFARAGYQVRGLEIQPDLVRYVREHLGFKADVGTLDSVVYPADSFDLVTICWVIEHLIDVKTVLEKIRRMLKPNGWIMAEVPLSDSLQSGLLRGRWSVYREAPRHIGIPSRSGLERAFSNSGFTGFRILPSGLLGCSGAFSLSIITGATTTHTYGSKAAASHLPRLAAGLLTVLHLPIALAENYLFHRPAYGVAFARKSG
jgi:SAM-dependent methyltransferase